jgi:mannose/cellobiose epimerase-like protein (N-acyl-D-glucosamine 2-epimerase family)
MILLGACPLLRRIGRPDAAAFGAGFLAHVLDRHLDPQSGLLANAPGGRAANPGHAIEMIGFAFEDGTLARGETAQRLVRLLAASFRAGFDGTGIALSVDAATGETLTPLRPWWSLPEAIRAAALAHAETGDPEALAVWEAADAAFFAHYWRPGTGLAIQTRGPDGPVDHVPATPDLDPGYHTGLSLLAAARAAEHLTREDT